MTRTSFAQGGSVYRGPAPIDPDKPLLAQLIDRYGPQGQVIADEIEKAEK